MSTIVGHGSVAKVGHCPTLQIKGYVVYLATVRLVVFYRVE